MNIMALEIFRGKTVRFIRNDGRDNEVWVPVNDVADAIGYDRETLRQLINRNKELFTNFCSSYVILLEGIGNREVLCVNRDGLVALLVKISANRIKDEIRRQVITEFQRWVVQTISKILSGEYRPEEFQPWAAKAQEHLEFAKVLVQTTGIKPDIAYAAAIEATEKEIGRSLEPYKKLFSPATAKSEEKPATISTEKEILGVIREYVNKNRERIYGFGAKALTNSEWVGAKSKVNKEECIVLFERSLAKALTQHNLDIVQVKKALKSAGLIITRREGRKERFGIKIHKRDLQGSGLAFPVNSLFLH